MVTKAQKPCFTLTSTLLIRQDSRIRLMKRFEQTNLICQDYQKLDEVPYDFIRKRLSVLVSKDNKNLMVTKGALQNVLDVCASVETSEGTTVQISGVQQQIQQRFEEFSSKGFRVLGIAYKDLGSEKLISKDSEVGMTFLGFLVLFDPSKPKIAETISELKRLGISLKIVTGDNRLVAASISQQVGFPNSKNTCRF